MKKLIILAAGLTLVLAGCAPQLSSEKAVKNDSSTSKKKLKLLRKIIFQVTITAQFYLIKKARHAD